MVTSKYKLIVNSSSSKSTQAPTKFVLTCIPPISWTAENAYLHAASSQSSVGK